MNKILNINLGGMPFTIDIDAYSNLDNYLETIRRHFSDSESCDEIIHDIEVRMGELFEESMKGNAIISNKELDEVIKIMGTPEDFGAEPIDDYEPSHQSDDHQSRESHSGHTEKRLFRDGEDKIVAGLCSGLSAYLGIADPLWIRIAFVVLVVSGISPIIYLLFWVIVPTAKTASDKLAMRGENINISNIAKTVEDEISELSKRITEIGKDFKKKSDGISADSKPKRNFILRGIAGIFTLVGKIYNGVLKLVKGIVKPIFKVAGGVAVLGLAIGFIAFIIALSFSIPYATHVGPDSYFISTLGSLSLYLLIGIPLFVLLTLVTRLTFGYKLSSKWGRSLGLMWIGSLIVCSFAASKTAQEYQVHGQLSDVFSQKIGSGTVNLKLSDRLNENSMFSFGDLELSGEGLVIDDVDIKILKSDNNEFKVEKLSTAMGTDKETALSNAATINSVIEVNENGQVTIPRGFRLPKGKKYRGQAVQYNIYVPEGMKVAMDQGVRYHLHSSDFNKEFDKPRDLESYQWSMDKAGLTSSEYNDKINYEMKIPVESIKKLFIEGKFNIDLVKGDSPSISIVGNQEIVEKVTNTVHNGIVEIKNNNRWNKSLKLYVYVNDLDQLNLKNITSASLKELNQKDLTIYNVGRGDISGTMDIKNLSLNLDGSQKVDILGTGENLDINVSSQTKLNLEKYSVQNATINGNLYRSSKINVSELLTTTDRNLQYIDVLGNPEIASNEVAVQ